MKTFRLSIYLMALTVFVASCGTTKHISKQNVAFQYVDNQLVRLTDPNKLDVLNVYEIRAPITSVIEDKSDFLIIKSPEQITNSKPIKQIEFDEAIASKVALSGKVYSTEQTIQSASEFNKPFTYWDIKIALQTFSVPLRFRNKMEKDAVKYPSVVETGVNVGFAPVAKWSWNVFDPIKKTLGKSLNQYSVNPGLMFNIGATDLKAASNAHGLLVDRKYATFTYGVFLMFGVNNINFGYALGSDNVLGTGRKNWIYQGKTWHGLVIALDIIKP